MIPETEFKIAENSVSFHYSRDGCYKIGSLSTPNFTGTPVQVLGALERYQYFLSFVSDKLKELNANNT